MSQTERQKNIGVIWGPPYDIKFNFDFFFLLEGSNHIESDVPDKFCSQQKNAIQKLSIDEVQELHFT